MDKPQQGGHIDRLLFAHLALDVSNGRSVSLPNFLLQTSEFCSPSCTYVYQEFIQKALKCISKYTFSVTMSLYKGKIYLKF